MFRRDPKTAQMGKEIFPFEMGYLPDFFKRKAEVELNDTSKNREKGLAILKEFIKNDKNMNDMSFDDDLLLQFLRFKKFNEERAFTQLKSFVNLRKNHKDLFTGYSFEKIAIGTRKHIATYLPYRCQDGCTIFLIKLENWIPEEFPVEEIKRFAVILFAQSNRDIMTQVNGYKAIFDVESNPIRHIRHATPSNLYLMYHGIMIIFHATAEGLLDYFPASVLPVEYGGQLKDYDMTYWLKDVMSPEKLATIVGGPYTYS